MKTVNTTLISMFLLFGVSASGNPEESSSDLSTLENVPLRVERLSTVCDIANITLAKAVRNSVNPSNNANTVCFILSGEKRIT